MKHQLARAHFAARRTNGHQTRGAYSLCRATRISKPERRSCEHPEANRNDGDQRNLLFQAHVASLPTDDRPNHADDDRGCNDDVGRGEKFQPRQQGADDNRAGGAYTLHRRD